MHYILNKVSRVQENMAISSLLAGVDTKVVYIKKTKIVIFIVSPWIFIYLLVFTNICTFIVIKILHKQSLM